MFKAGTLLLSAYLFTAPLFTQDGTKRAAESEVVVKQLKEKLAIAEAALNESREAEAKAKEAAVNALQQAQAAQKAAEVERDKALVAREQAEKERLVAERSRLEALREAEAAAVAEARAQVAAKEAAQKAAMKPKGDAVTKNPQPERGKKGKGRRAALAQQVEALTKQMQQMQSELNALKAQFKTGQLKPGLGGKEGSDKVPGNSDSQKPGKPSIR